MKDIMQMSWEASKVAKSPKEQRELFTEMLFAEFAKMKSADIAPHISCNFDVIHREYRVVLSFKAQDQQSRTEIDVDAIAENLNQRVQECLQEQSK